jgi:hypothetical protein
VVAGCSSIDTAEAMAQPFVVHAYQLRMPRVLLPRSPGARRARILSGTIACLAILSLAREVSVQPAPQDHLFPVFEDGKLGYIDASGRIVIAPQLERVDEYTHDFTLIHFSEGLAGATSGGKWGFIDAIGGWAAQPHFDAIDRFSEGLAAVELDGRWGFIDRSGRMVIEPTFESAGAFGDGLAPVSVQVADDNDGPTIKYGYIDRAGRLAVPPRFDHARSFSNGRAAVGVGSRTGYIDSSGDVVIRPQFTRADDFADGVAFVQTGWSDRGYRILDTAGRLKSAPASNLVSSYSEGWAVVTMKGKDGTYFDGYIDKNGTFALSRRFRDARDFSEGLAPARLEGPYGYIDKSGAFVLTPQFARAGIFHRGLALASRGRVTGYINRLGEFVWSSDTWDVRAPKERQAEAPPVETPTAGLQTFSPSPLRWGGGAHLEAMGEPSLWLAAQKADVHVYRFLWLRTFHHPVALRIDVAPDGTARLSAKVTTGAGGYEPGVLRTDKSVPLTRAQVKRFLDGLEKAKFWTLPTAEPEAVGKDGSIRITLDGALWTIEGVTDGRYHVVDRHSPARGAFRDAALLLLRFADLGIKEIY